MSCTQYGPTRDQLMGEGVSQSSFHQEITRFHTQFLFFIFYLTLVLFERTYTFQTESSVSGKPQGTTLFQLTIVSTNFLYLTASFQFMYGTLFFLTTVFSRFFNKVANVIFVSFIFSLKIRTWLSRRVGVL